MNAKKQVNITIISMALLITVFTVFIALPTNPKVEKVIDNLIAVGTVSKPTNITQDKDPGITNFTIKRLDTASILDFLYVNSSALDGKVSLSQFTIDGNNSTLYCIEPGMFAPTVSGTDYEKTGDITGEDVAIKWLYQNAYPNKELYSSAIYKGGSFVLSYDEIITNVVARLITAGDNRETGTPESAIYYYTKIYLDNGTCGNDAKCEEYRIRPRTSETGATEIYDIIVDLYHRAMSAKESDLWNGKIEFSDDLTTEESDIAANGTFTKIVNGSLLGLGAFDLSSDKSFVNNFKVTCNNNDVNCELLDINGNSIDPSTHINRIGYDPYEYQVKITGNINDVNNEKLTVSLSVDYFDIRSLENPMEILPSDDDSYQKMLIFPENITHTISQTFVITFGEVEPDCDTLPTDDPYYLEHCVLEDDCISTDFSNTCGDIGTDIGDTVEYTLNEGVKENGDLDYEFCVIDKEDSAGNSRNIVDNRYCVVSCKEDWSFELPGQINDIRTGSYFMMSANVGGTRTCVSSDIKYSGNSEGSFLYDLEQINKEIVEAYNEYVYWDGWEITSSEAVSKTCSDGEWAERNCKTVDGVEECEEYCKTTGTVTVSSTKYTYSVDVPQYLYISSTNGTGTIQKINNRTETKDSQKGDSDGAGCKSSCTIGDINEDFPQEIKENLAATKKAYEDLVEERDKMLAEINECSNFENELAFDPILSYSYGENYYMENHIKEGSGNYFVVTNEGAEKSTDDYWTSSSQNYTRSATNDDTPTAEKSFITCTLTGGCTSTSIDVPTSINVMKTDTKSALYKPYTVFLVNHPTGNITSVQSEDEVVGQPDEITTVMGRVFPISMTSKGGTYRYHFAFNQIGQFNEIQEGSTTANGGFTITTNTEDDETGRLMNYDDREGIEIAGTSNVVELDINNDFYNKDKESVFDTLDGLNATYTCFYGVYEDICKCCGEELEVYDEIWYEPPTNTGNGSGVGTGITSHMALYYKPVSLNDLFPELNGNSGSGTITSIGANWSTEKGQYVLDQIQQLGDEAYKTPEYSFLLTPAATANIREYNSDNELNDFNLSCNEYGYNCTSNFLTDFDEIAGYEGAVTMRGGLEVEGRDMSKIESKEYFTGWSTDTQTHESFQYNANSNAQMSGIGPSMK